METDFTPRLDDWLASKAKNEELIVVNTMQILMAQEVLKLCDKKIKFLEKQKEMHLKRQGKKKKLPTGI